MQSPDQSSQRPPVKGDDAPPGRPHHPAAPSATSRNGPLFGILVTLALLAIATVIALRQPPHADMLRAVAAWDIGNPSWWAYPLERNAFKRGLIRGNLHDLHRLPGTRQLWAVGESGLVLHSDDGGEHWAQQHPVPPQRPATSPTFSLNLIGSAQAAIASGKAPYQPNAKSVEQKPLDPKQIEQKQVEQQADPQQQIRQETLPVENQPAINKLPPASKLPPLGQRLPKVPAAPVDPEKADLNAVYFSDADHGWAVGHGGSMLVTADGGAHWRPQATGTAVDLSGIVFSADAQRGWLFPKAPLDGSQASVPRVTSDGGRSWSNASVADLLALTQDMVKASGRDSLSFRSLQHGLLREGGREGWYLDGHRLTALRVPATQASTVAELPDFTPTALQVSADGQRILMVGTNGRIRYSTDAAKSWKNADMGQRADLQAVQCDATLDDCLAIGNGGMVLRGKALTSWRSLTPGYAANLVWARFKDNGEDGDAVSAASIQYATDDGGMTWSSLGETKLPADAAKDVFGFVDGNFRWRVGIGSAERSDDGGRTWRSAMPATQTWLLSVFFLADHQRGWISGADGSIFVTRDGGKTWQPQTTSTHNWLWHVSMDANGKTGRALGAYGTVLLTDDGGAHWRESAFYSRYPAPWFWLFLAAAGIALTVLVPRHLRSRNQIHEIEDGPAASLNSDQPITHVDNDRLGYRPAIEALANFLSNEATEPRITLAITGEWGSGKSSMMRMLQTEMAAKGYRTAWFNAWHHQQEGRQLTALFNVVRRQGVPTFFRQPVAALRVRSRLIWGRSAFYRFVCIAIPVVVLVAVGDFSRQPDRWERFKWWVAHQTLQWERVVVTDKTIEKLRSIDAKPAVEQSAPKAEPATAQSAPAAALIRAQVRPEVLTYMRNALVWESGQKRHCGDARNISDEDRCVFKQPDQLLVTIEKGTGLTLWPSEREAILKAAEPLPVPALFPALEHFIVPLLGLLGLLFTKGMTVYGLEVLRPLRNLFGTAPTSEGGKEVSGAIEHYRREYCLLTEALDGRLLVFVDDIDRCNADTVNGIMELTNYLVDVGRCFVVLGMAMERVKASIRAPNAGSGAEADYADKYLRKLVHIELPVPLANAQESLGLFIQRAEAKSREAVRKEAERRKLAQWWSMLRPWLIRVTVLFVMFTAAALAVRTGRLLNNYRLPAALKIAPVEESSVPLAQPTGYVATNPLPVPGAAETPASAPTAGGDVGLSASPPTALPWRLLGVVLAIVLIALAVRSSRVLQERVTLALGGTLRTRDSDVFREALQIWLDAVRIHDETPRGIKRFCNRARLFAIYEKQDVEALKREGRDIEPTRDVHIVALAAIHHVSPEALGALVTLNENNEERTLQVLPLFQQLPELLACQNKHVERFGWPDTDAIRRFIERVEHIAVR